MISNSLDLISSSTMFLTLVRIQAAHHGVITPAGCIYHSHITANSYLDCGRGKHEQPGEGSASEQNIPGRIASARWCERIVTDMSTVGSNT